MNTLAIIFALAGTAVEWTRRPFGLEKLIQRILNSPPRPQPVCSPARFPFGFLGCHVLTYPMPPVV
jgi:hypothetical protein